ncbi:MAG: hypothetical protein ACRCST_05325 [Turicibacter sp.]
MSSSEDKSEPNGVDIDIIYEVGVNLKRHTIQSKMIDMIFKGIVVRMKSPHNPKSNWRLYEIWRFNHDIFQAIDSDLKQAGIKRTCFFINFLDLEKFKKFIDYSKMESDVEKYESINHKLLDNKVMAKVAAQYSKFVFAYLNKNKDKNITVFLKVLLGLCVDSSNIPMGLSSWEYYNPPYVVADKGIDGTPSNRYKSLGPDSSSLGNVLPKESIKTPTKIFIYLNFIIAAIFNDISFSKDKKSFIIKEKNIVKLVRECIALKKKPGIGQEIIFLYLDEPSLYFNNLNGKKNTSTPLFDVFN